MSKKDKTILNRVQVEVREMPFLELPTFSDELHTRVVIFLGLLKTGLGLEVAFQS